VFSINLTDFSDEEYHKRLRSMQTRVKDEIKKGLVRIEVFCTPEKVNGMLKELRRIQFEGLRE
jgi:hypothetical protein